MKATAISLCLSKLYKISLDEIHFLDDCKVAKISVFFKTSEMSL